MLENTKPAMKSLTIVSNVLSIGVLAAGVLVREIGPAEQQTIVDAGTAVSAGVLQLVSIWGRLRAKKKIG